MIRRGTDGLTDGQRMVRDAPHPSRAKNHQHLKAREDSRKTGFRNGWILKRGEISPSARIFIVKDNRCYKEPQRIDGEAAEICVQCHNLTVLRKMNYLAGSGWLCEDCRPIPRGFAW